MIAISKAVFALAMNELTEVHKQADLAGAPRRTEDGAPLSAAQRVTHVVGTLVDCRNTVHTVTK
jgi:hypothetical protein